MINEKLWSLLYQIRDKLPHPIASIKTDQIVWKKMNEGNIGYFNWMSPNQICMNSLYRNSPESYLVSTLAHELHHKYQFENNKIMYFIGLVPLLRNILLERTAIEVEEAADNLSGLTGIRSQDRGSGIV